MTDKLKVFNNVVDANSTNNVTEVTIASNSATEQAVIKNVEFSASDPVYPITASIKHDNRTAYAADQVEPKETTSATLTGSQIVDSNSTYKLVLDTGQSAEPFVPLIEAAYFSGDDEMYYISDTRTEFLAGAVTFDEVVPTLSVASSVSGTADAYSAFGWKEGENLRFAAHSGTSTSVYNELGQLQYTTASYPVNCFGATADDTYIYAVPNGNNNVIYRRLRSDGTSATNLSLSTSIIGQDGNQGSFTLYYNGYLYSKHDGDVTVIYKIDTTTGSVTVISDLNLDVGIYSVGAAITVAKDGTPYIIEQGVGTESYAVNLNTNQVTRLSGGYSLGTTTEYGNIALEIAPGIVWFGFNSNGVWIDANTMTRASANVPSSTIGLPNIINSTVASSIANIPLYKTPTSIAPRNVTYSLYADGVKVTGV